MINKKSNLFIRRGFEVEKFYSEKNNKKNLFVIVFIFFTLVTLAVFYIFMSSESNLAENFKENKEIPMSEVFELDNVVQDGPLDENKGTKADAQNDQDDQDDDEFVFVINKKVVFKSASSLGDIKIENPATNKYNFYIEIKLKDDEEIIYKSPELKPNQHIKSDYLIKKLSKGTHDSIATVFVVDPETHQVIAEQQTNIQIKIKK